LKKSITIDTVAKEASVSRATVSRVLNDYTIVSKEKKQKVLAAIEKLKFEPSKIAQSLTGKKTNTVGVIVENITNPFFSKIIKGIESTLKKLGYLMILGNSDYIHKDKISVLKKFIQYQIDGIIASLIGYHDKDDLEVVQLLNESKLPFFLLNCSIKDDKIPWIENDNVEGGYLATNHLLKLGHKKIMYFTYSKVKGIKSRFKGFKRSLNENGLNMKDQVIIDGVISRIDGHRLTNDFIKQNGINKLPSAIIASNDIVAVGIMEALTEHNIRIPDDISIVGYDDIEMSDFLQVPLTTIHQPQHKMGEIAASELVRKIEKGKFSKGKNFYLIKPELIVRKSTAPFKQKN